MPKPRLMYADVLARLLFAKSVDDLSATERAEFEILRALESDEDDERRYEELADARAEESRMRPFTDPAPLV
jgi:hypothetical protein